jgi:FdhD protein
VDKVLGALLRENKRAALLMVSGRVSFEIVQKAAVSAVGAVAGVSAPTGLAVDLAERAGVVLAGFVRGNHVNVYAHAAAVTGTDAVTGS